jgi:hypothetical protein
MHREALCEDLLDLRPVVLSAIAQGGSNTNVRSQNLFSSGTPESARTIAGRFVGSCFCPGRPTMQARESKRARESVLACCRRLLSAGRQTVRGQPPVPRPHPKDARRLTIITAIFPPAEIKARKSRRHAPAEPHGSALRIESSETFDLPPHRDNDSRYAKVT